MLQVKIVPYERQVFSGDTNVQHTCGNLFTRQPFRVTAIGRRGGSTHVVWLAVHGPATKQLLVVMTDHRPARPVIKAVLVDGPRLGCHHKFFSTRFSFEDLSSETLESILNDLASTEEVKTTARRFHSAVSKFVNNVILASPLPDGCVVPVGTRVVFLDIDEEIIETYFENFVKFVEEEDDSVDDLMSD